MRQRREPQRLMIATESFGGALDDGSPFTVHKDTTRIYSDHEIVRRHPQWFKPIDAHYGVEAATAGPGEMRE